MAEKKKGQKTGSVFTETKKTGEGLWKAWGGMKILGDKVKNIDAAKKRSTKGK